MEALFNRVSTREFADRPVENKKVERILKAAMSAPSACNQQPWEFVVVTDPEILARLGDATKYSSPAAKCAVAIVPCMRTQGLKSSIFAAQDMAACTQNILVEATELGLGSVWLGVYPKEGRMEMVRSILGISDKLDPFAIVALGYSEEEKRPMNRFDESRIRYIKPKDKMAEQDTHPLEGTIAGKMLGIG